MTLIWQRQCPESVTHRGHWVCEWISRYLSQGKDSINGNEWEFPDAECMRYDPVSGREASISGLHFLFFFGSNITRTKRGVLCLLADCQRRQSAVCWTCAVHFTNSSVQQIRLVSIQFEQTGLREERERRPEHVLISRPFNRLTVRTTSDMCRTYFK